MTQDNGSLAVAEPPTNQLQQVDLAPQNGKANPRFGSKGIEIASFEDAWKMACVIARSPFAPKGMEKAETIFVAIQLGMEIGMSPMAAMQSIAVINGRPGIYGDAALAIVRGSGHCQYFLEFESNDEVHGLAKQLAVALEFNDQPQVKALRQKIAAASASLNEDDLDFGYSCISKRVSAPASVVSRFTLSDAKAAGLLGKSGPWSQYRKRMLMWRCRGFNLRDNFGDVLKGMATTEEAGDTAVTTISHDSTAELPTNTSTISERIEAKRSNASKAVTSTILPPAGDVGGSASPAAEAPAAATDVEVDEAAQVLRDDDESQINPAAENDSQIQNGKKPVPQPDLPSELPPDARTNVGWIEAVVVRRKPNGMTAHAARKFFHALDVGTWPNLLAPRQNEKYAGLMDGSIWAAKK